MTKNNQQKNIVMKKSGIDWIGNIPSDWEVVPLLKFFKISRNKIKEGVVSPLSVGYMGVVPQLENAAKNIANGDRKYIKVGDIVINGRSDRMGAVGLSKYEGGVSLVYHVLRPRFKFENKYFHYLFRNKMFSQEFYKRGNGIVADLWTTKDSELKRIQVPTPPKPTQQKIVEFLDRKTEAVVELVTKKKKVIDLLKEKRSAIITQAVTKGLDENVKMKDSGVDWIGEIPDGWEVKRLFAFGTFFKGFGIARKDLTNNGLPAVLYGDIYTRYNIKTFELEKKIPKIIALRSRKIENGNILFAGSGETKEDIGKNIVYLGNEIGYAGGDILVFKQKKNNSLFLSYALVGKTSVAHKESTCTGEIIIHTTASKLKNLILAIPPKQTQQKIVEFLDKKTTEIDEIINKTEKQIKLLDEYKASLIYHAVTGKTLIS